MTKLLSNTESQNKEQADRQIKYLHLEAEVDMLLQRITTLIERRSTSAKSSQAKESSDLN